MKQPLLVSRSAVAQASRAAPRALGKWTRRRIPRPVRPPRRNDAPGRLHGSIGRLVRGG